MLAERAAPELPTLISPCTSSFVAGVAVPMPTVPAESLMKTLFVLPKGGVWLLTQTH